MPTETDRPLDFVRAKIIEDNRSGRYGGRVVTRFPPEPNGYLHIGHAKAICLDFGLAQEFGGRCNLRMDDTNPETEDEEFVAAIQHDLRWLGFDPGEKVYYASDYYPQLYDYAIQLIKAKKAYVDSSSEDEIRENRGSVSEPGKPGRYRDRSVEENLDLFQRMRKGEFPNGAHVLRAKIDLSSPNMKMRDPLLYRIRHKHHYRTGNDWPIYPMYDYAHCISDAIEGVTHSLCTLEFENNREIYDWVLRELGIENPPEQTEFARLALSYTVLSKRYLKQLVTEGRVDGWDDPRMPTLAGLRRRGIPPEAIRRLCEEVGVARTNSTVDILRFENAVRDVLNPEVPRVMAVLRPLKVTVTSFPEGRVEWLDAPLYPHDVPKEGSRRIAFTRELYIERDDFAEHPPKGFKRLVPGGEVRLRYGYFLRCEEVVKDAHGNVIELRCTHDPGTRGGASPADGRKVKGTIHWVSASESIQVRVRLYDRLFAVESPGATGDWKADLNPESLTILYDSRVETSIGKDPPGTRYQFERHGYFCTDINETGENALVFNRIVPLKDSWSKQVEEPAPAPAKAEKAAPVEPKKGEKPAAVPQLSPEERAIAEDLVDVHKLAETDAALLASDRALLAFFEAAVKVSGSPVATANWVVNDLRAAAKERGLDGLPIGGEALGQLVKLVESGTISTRTGKDLLAELVEKGGDPVRIVKEQGLSQVSDEAALARAIDGVLAAHPKELEAYRGGKTQLQGFFVGQVMKATQGRANPQLLGTLLSQKLAGG